MYGSPTQFTPIAIRATQKLIFSYGPTMREPIWQDFLLRHIDTSAFFWQLTTNLGNYRERLSRTLYKD